MQPRRLVQHRLGDAWQREACQDRDGGGKVTPMERQRQGVEGVLGQIKRELWLVTAADQDRRGGLVATWVSQATLDAEPAIIVVSLATNHFTRELVDASQALSLHLIGQRHSEIAFRFASASGKSQDKFAGLDWTAGLTGAPRIQDVVSWMDCKVRARLSTEDRVYYWAEVVAGEVVTDEPVLTDADWFPMLTPEQLAAISGDREHDIKLQRPQLRNWMENLPAGLQPARKDS